MSRLTFALSGRDSCSGACETRLGCDCISRQGAAPFVPVVPAQPDPIMPSGLFCGLFGGWIKSMRAAYIRHLIDIGEQRQLQLEAEIRANDTDLARLRIELALVEN